MIQRIFNRVLLLLLSCNLVLALHAADSTSATPAVERAVPAFHPISPGPGDGRIAYITARMLEQNHYLHQTFDGAVSSKLLDRYLDTLDPQHMHFLQSDLMAFEPYRTNLDKLTLNRRGASDVRPACDIFNLYMERLKQRIDYVNDLLKTENFTFDSDERITLNRHELPYPKDLPEAKALWRDRLRFEYLQEVLSKATQKKDKDKEKTTEANPDKKPAAAPKSEREQIVDTLTRRYNRNLRAFIDFNNEDVLQLYLTTLAHVYDPHSDYFGRSQLESFAIQMNLSLFGIGAELVSEDGYCTIRRLLPGGPAEKSKKIKEKDRIVAVAQNGQPPVDVVEMSLNKAVQLIRGPKGTEVQLTIIPAGKDPSATITLNLVRDEIKLEDQEAKAKIIEMPKGNGETARLGVIDLPSFYATFDVGSSRRMELANSRGQVNSKSTTADVARLLAKLKQEHVDGVILDLRRNGGGSLDEAIHLTGLFIKEGPVVQVRNWKNEVEVMDDNDPSVAYDGPLIVLTSRFSASASEILAGALQDYGRALVVGDSSTHGKGTVQSVNPLPPPSQFTSDKSQTNDPGALKVTIKKFYRASGASTQLRGVVPDIVLPSVLNESKDVGETALDNPLPYDTIDSAKFERLNLVTPCVTELRRRSSQRVLTDKDYDYVREDIEQYKKMQADKTISLNQSQRLKEKEEADARQKARDKERLARKDPSEKIYEISLKQAALPGLPPPVEKTNSVTAKLSINSSGSTNNSLAALSPAKSPTGDPDLDETAEDEKPPAIDYMLAETEHILMDYFSLFPRNDLATTVHRPE
jgi:carboxyl-terminal processing protease